MSPLRTKPDAKAKQTTTKNSSGVNKTLVLLPRMSEKTYALSQAQNTFVFDVPLPANKQQIMAAVAEQFNVTPLDARMVIVKGKTARSIRLGGKARKNVSGRRVDIKKAYVRIKDGESIPIFAAVEEAEKKEAEAVEKAAKKAKKESKK
jgi:ribosomal protein L23